MASSNSSTGSDTPPPDGTQATGPQISSGGTIPPNTELVKALWQAGLTPEADQSPLFTVLKDSKVIALLGAPPEIGPNGELLGLNYRGTRLNGETVVFACADTESLGRYTHNEPIPWLLTSFRDFCRDAIRGGFDGILLNPGGPVTLRVSRLQMESLVAGFVPGSEQTAQGTEDATVSFEKPRKPLPKRVRNAMRNVGRRVDAQELWWCWVKLGETEPKLGIGVAPAGEQTVHAVRDALTGVPELLVKEGFSRDGTMHVLPMEGEVGATLREVGEMIYRAGRT